MAIVVGTDVVVGSSVVGYSVVGFSVVGSSGVGVVGSCVVDSSVAVVGPCVVGSSVVGLSVSGVVGKDVVAVGAAVVCEAADQSSNLKTRTTRKSVRPTPLQNNVLRVSGCWSRVWLCSWPQGGHSNAETGPSRVLTFDDLFDHDLIRTTYSRTSHGSQARLHLSCTSVARS